MYEPADAEGGASTAAPGRRFIFLDYNGVMLPSGHGADWTYERCVAALNHIVAETGAAIVVTSSMRGTAAAAVRQLQSWGVIGSVAGVATRSVPGRANQVRAWLDTHPATGFVILDDDRGFDDLEAHLVQTDWLTGLTMADAERAIAILRGEPGPGDVA